MPRQYPFPSLHVLNSLLLGSTHEGPQEQCSTPWSSSCAASQPASPLQASSELDQGSVLGQCGDDSPPFHTQQPPQTPFQVIMMRCFVIIITEENPWIGVKCMYTSHTACVHCKKNILTVPYTNYIHCKIFHPRTIPTSNCFCHVAHAMVLNQTRILLSNHVARGVNCSETF